jgi:hypothetical protein
MKSILVLIFVTLFSTATFAQMDAGEPTHGVAEYEAILQLYSAAKKLSAKELGCTTHDDCLELELGSLACGGPQEYLTVSKFNRNLSEIKYLAKRSVKREDQYNRDYGINSICIVRAPGIPKCFKRQCVVSY